MLSLGGYPIYGDYTRYCTLPISQIATEEINNWKKRKLKKRYTLIMLDGMWLSVRRNTVAKEVVLFVLGIDENGFPELCENYLPKECGF